MKVINTEKLPIKMWLNDIEDGAVEQLKNLANLPFAFKWVCAMPDCHQGYGMPIGGVLATKGVIVPNAVGVDIGCGMCAVESNHQNVTQEELKEIMSEIRKVIPLGFKHQKDRQEWDGFNKAPKIEIIQKELESAKYQLGTLGGGNHFIELQKSDSGHLWIMIHSGSRNFGLKTATEYHKKAVAMCERYKSDIPTKDLSFLPMDSKDGKRYIQAMQYCVDFALANRELMMNRVLEILKKVLPEKTRYYPMINIAHNYAKMENHFGENVMVHRKGATLARKDTIGIIPGSMGTSSYIVKGLGNPESFESCSHGAGRRMGRKQAIKELDLAHEQEIMKDILGKPRGQNDLEEAPSAYKDIIEVMDNQKDLVEILVTLKPLAVIKG